MCIGSHLHAESPSRPSSGRARHSIWSPATCSHLRANDAGAAGVDVGIRRVQLPNSDVFANAYLYADLDNVPRIVDRLVLALDRNPEILTQVLMTVDTAVNAVG